MLRKGPAGEYGSVLGKMKAATFSWTAGEKTTTVTVEDAYPHRILAFKEPDGSHGELIAVKRLPYWKLHDNDDLHYRKELGLIEKLPETGK